MSSFRVESVEDRRITGFTIRTVTVTPVTSSGQPMGYAKTHVMFHKDGEQSVLRPGTPPSPVWRYLEDGYPIGATVRDAVAEFVAAREVKQFREALLAEVHAALAASKEKPDATPQ